MAEKMSLAEIDNIKDFMDGLEILENRDLVIDGIIDLDDIKEILRLKYHSKFEDDSQNAHKKSLRESYPTLTEELKKQLQHVKDIIRLDLFQKEFGEIYKLSKERIMEKQKKLEELIERKSFPILTAGEAKAGKSTLINLLLGTKLMPMDLVTCTRMICEIRKSENKRATFILNENDESTNHVISLEGNVTEAISSFVKQEGVISYKKGIFEYPVDFLDEYTYLVDSPGIGDTTPLEKITFDFLNENSPAFIFVLNATNSNGLNLKATQLIKKARDELTKESNFFITDEASCKPSRYNSFELDKAIFILNHWDIVRANAKSKEEVEVVRSTIIKEIQTLWHESAVEGVQIFFMSALQARQWSAHGLIQTELIKLRQSLSHLIGKLYERNFQNCLELLHDILDYIEKEILMKINIHVDRKYGNLYNKKHAEELCSLLEVIITNTDKRREKITNDLKPKFVEMATSLTAHLKSKEVETRILNIALSKITIDKNIDFLSIILKKILENQLYEELKIWQNNSNEIENLYSHLNGLFEDHLIEISNQITIKNMLIDRASLISAWNSSNHKEMKKFDSELITKIEQVFIITTITLLFPVVALAGLLATPLIFNFMLKEKRANQDNLKKYEEDKEGYLRKIINESLSNLSENDVRRCFFKNLSDKCMYHIKAFDVFIKTELLEKRQMIKEIESETRDIPVILSNFNILLRKIEEIYGEYHILRIKNKQDIILTRRSTYYLKDNETLPTMSEIVSIGKNSKVFRLPNFKDTLFKMYTKSLSKKHARYQMNEIEVLSSPPDQYILHLKHYCHLEKENKLLLVLGNVDCNLYKYLNDNRDLVPIHQKHQSPEWVRALNFVIDVSKQLCNGLEKLNGYDRRMVHPDFRIETVLVSKTENPEKVNIFFCDACSNLPTQRLHKFSGNIQDQQLEHSFDMGGYTKENIYRLGIIIYKMTYFEFEKIGFDRQKCDSILGGDFSESDFMSIESFESDINTDWTHKKHLNIPEALNDLIKKCIDKQPQNRPTTKDCINVLESFNL